MTAAPPLVLIAPLVAGIFSFVTNGKIITEYMERRKERDSAASATLAQNEANDAFSKTAFEAFLYLPLTAIFAVAALLVLSIITAVLWLAFDSAARASVTEDAAIRIAAVLFVTSILLTIAWPNEPHLELRLLPKRKRPWEAERIAARRVKAEKSQFVVDAEKCEHLARSVLDKLQTDPSWLFGTLLPEKGDPAALANEILFGVVCEQLQPNTFDPEWKRFSRIRSMAQYGTLDYILHPEQVRKRKGRDIAGEVKKIFAAYDLVVLTHLVDKLANVADRLRKSYGGDANALFRVVAPRGAMLVVLAVAAVVVWGMLGHPRAIHYVFNGAGYVLDAGLVVAVLAASVVLHVLLTWRSWVAFVLVRCRIWRVADCVNWRLTRFSSIRQKSGTRTAFLKFSSEYGLLTEDVDEQLFGESAHVRWALFNAGAIRTDGETFDAYDPDLTFYTQAALRLIAEHIDRALDDERAAWRAELPYLGAKEHKGQFLGINIADGAMFLIGREYCGQSSWKSPARDCPAITGGVCEVQSGTRFKFDEEAHEFKRDPRPEKATSA
jgi:hypothetical protein